MAAAPAELWLVRHGETEWSRDGRHTSVTELPLTEAGEQVAESLRPRLADVDFDLVLTSPRQRARRTAELAGFPEAEVDDDLAEWAYGEYEGISTLQIRESVPGWTVWDYPCPGGESAEQVGDRLDRVVARVRADGGRCLAFGHGHASRVLAARWLGLPVRDGCHFALDTATISVLSAERESPVVQRWNS
ncbi:histidine phosphatase family protein [Nocardioides mangrovicus]|uniref:Histidine phosphatase family protein n=1 Tax=Nocardioides mangrovicus TaxID=2478913 RepID=A0A3L8P6J5_9ACTN|nr:histidine phosphatase family protein [Nocardioides mangrovicus]RLV50851.1 histidine phosphatase family protein [Nocardioides mangrovicus]